MVNSIFFPPKIMPIMRYVEEIVQSGRSQVTYNTAQEIWNLRAV